jgi:uncharacterized membrane protein YidH (DUF202 family)
MVKISESYAHDIAKRPTDMLALGRAAMANERTLLAFVSTSVRFLAASAGLITSTNQGLNFAGEIKTTP